MIRHARGPSTDGLSIALLGTRGVPARYGGFETCVEEVGVRLVERGHDVVVYGATAADGASSAREHRGMRLVPLPAVRRRSLETISRSALATGHLAGHRLAELLSTPGSRVGSTRAVDAAVVFNAANAPFLPVLRACGIPVATHVDGLEWKRAKWGPVGQRYYRWAESFAVRHSDALIADAQGIADHYRRRFDADTTLIRYGAPVVEGGGDPRRLATMGLVPGGYHLVVARFEPENHVDVVVEGYVASRARKPLVVVGSAPYSDAYTARVHALADHRVRLVGGVWDQDLLDQLYAGAATYLHGHSVGGTNPSLLRAIGAGTAVDAFDVDFNREVLGAAGTYWSTPADVALAVEAAEADEDRLRDRGRASRFRAASYDWDDVADGYEDLCRRLAGRSPLGRRSADAAVVDLTERPTALAPDDLDLADLDAEPQRRRAAGGRGGRR
jgi:glycosyltransferase involved in cell wall biosynthesis